MNIPNNIREVLDILQECGFEPYLVGGCVRDTVMGIVPHDYDITSNASPEAVTECFELRGYKTYPLGKEFGTVCVLAGDEVVEITPYRTEGTYSDSRHPDTVEFVSDIRLDLSRRDFTVNAMAIDARGNILDLFDGIGDIEKGIIRCVGNPYERLSEDALRTLRALRFAARLGFEIDADTKKAMTELSPLLHNISGERIYSELSEILCAKHAYSVLPDCEEIIKTVIPAFHVSEKLKDGYGDFLYRLFTCIFDGGKKAAEDIHKLMKLSNVERDRLYSLFDVYSTLCGDTPKKLALDNSVKKLLCSESSEAVLDIFRFTDSDTAELSDYIENGVYTLEKLAIKGGEVVKLGRFPKQNTAKIMCAILFKVALGELENTAEAIFAFLESADIDFGVEV